MVHCASVVPPRCSAEKDEVRVEVADFGKKKTPSDSTPSDEEKA